MYYVQYHVLTMTVTMIITDVSKKISRGTI